jgi:uncharacterized protein (DUF1810 family)
MSRATTMPPEPSDPYILARFVEAQDAIYDQALEELRAGRKQSHWSWFILPQLRGLGSSAMSVRFGIGSMAEAKAYLQHPVLGARLRECVAAMNAHEELSASEVLGPIDARKFCSCLTLFAEASAADAVFNQALAKYFLGKRDAATVAMLARHRAANGEP